MDIQRLMYAEQRHRSVCAGFPAASSLFRKFLCGGETIIPILGKHISKRRGGKANTVEVSFSTAQTLENITMRSMTVD